MRKKHPEHVNLERWLVSYADFITLLFAFFVVMYAISQADIAKFKKVAASIKAAFSAGPSGMIDTGGQSGGATINPMDVKEQTAGRLQNLPAGKTHTAADPDPELLETKELLEESVSLELGVADLSDKLQMQFDSRGLIIRIAAKDFFDEGEALVRPDLRPVLDKIGAVLKKTKRLIRVEGHADSHETNLDRFPSSWELSAARAAWVANYWIQKMDYDPSRLGIAGYGHFRPISQKSDQWSQARNRRIEIIVLNNLYEAP